MKQTIIYNIILLFSVVSCNSNNTGLQSVLSDIKLAEGDIVFRKGKGIKSQTVLNVDSLGVYSHTGIIVRKDGVFYVVHITPDEREKGETVDKIKMEKIEDFFSDSKAVNGAIMRFVDSTDMPKVAAQQAVRLCQKGILFDHNYNLKDSTKMYCTEMLYCAYSLAGRDITEGRRHILQNVSVFSGEYIFPSDIYLNDKLKIYFQF